MFNFKMGKSKNKLKLFGLYLLAGLYIAFFLGACLLLLAVVVYALSQLNALGGYVLAGFIAVAFLIGVGMFIFDMINS